VTDLWYYSKPFIIMGLAVIFTVGWVIGSTTIVTIVGLILFSWAMVEWTLYEQYEREAREARYASMSTEQKIDHHLEVARRYNSNTDANIAQALIERRHRG
jgi:ABC-type protease/lipase transport system fused ATPase/permease subunit